MSSGAAAVGPVESDGKKKRPFHHANGGRGGRFQNNKRQKKAEKPAVEGSHEEVLLADIRALLARASLQDVGSNGSAAVNSNNEVDGRPGKGDEPSKQPSLPELQTEVDLTVSEISSTGDALALSEDSKHIYVVPFSSSGDVVRAKVFKHFQNEHYSLTDFIKVVKAGPLRDDTRVRCPYFASCSGCQFQMLSYDEQLKHKRTIVEKAYQNFSRIDPSLVPSVKETMGSPLEYGYRTKLTPHFDGPPGGRRDRRNGITPSWSEVPPIGFMKKGTRQTIDIEDCPIGTEAVRLGMKRERQRVNKEIDTYKRGATLLLRENTQRLSKSQDTSTESLALSDANAVFEDRGPHIHKKTCETDSNARTTEYIDDFIFENPAGAFFQNNNSILPSFTQYIRDNILPPSSVDEAQKQPQITHLIDAYSGSGLFTITLSSLFKRSIGIDISPSSIVSATKNAQLNGLPESQAKFLAADAANLFASVNGANKEDNFPADETVVVIDPPRKGCDESFLSQLLRFSPQRVVYVSCNVHTQARDVGMLVGGMKGVDGGFGAGEGVYEIESLRGFDFFPQTSHVEGVAVLRKKVQPVVAP